VSLAFLLTSLIIVAMPGTAALLRASGVAFDALRVTGVAYLLIMAVMTVRDKSELVIEDEQPARSPARVIGSAMLSNLLNPKLTIFFFAFLPQFVPTHAPDEVERLLLLSGVFMAMTFVVFVIYGVAASALRRHVIERPRAIQRVRRLFAASFVGLGVKLATTSR
jgi:threonine/homoserine/homoserine lactone efflux protein